MSSTSTTEATRQLIEALLKAAESYGLVRKEDTDVGMPGWQLQGSAVLWKAGDLVSPKQANDNAFFRGLYRNIACFARQPRTSALRL